MGSLFQVNNAGILKAEGFDFPLQDINNYNTSITILVPGISSITANDFFYVKLGKLVNINVSFSINIGSGIPGLQNDPIFNFSVPFLFNKNSTAIGCTTDIYKEGLNLGQIGILRLKSSIELPTSNINVYISNNNPSVLNSGNNPFSAQFNFFYYSV